MIRPGVAEIKRMYLKPDARGRNIGRMMIDGLLDAARDLGCYEARLDSGWFMTDAHRLYRAAGFTECEPYPESEISPDSIRAGSTCAATSDRQHALGPRSDARAANIGTGSNRRCV